MDDDFNTALALSQLFSLFRQVAAKCAAGDASCAEDAKQVRATYSLLGLFKKDAKAYLPKLRQRAPRRTSPPR